MEKEWWELPRTVPDANRRRKGRVTWLMSAEIKLWIPPPTSETERQEDSGTRFWLVPCRCGSKRCDGVRTVSQSDGGVRFIGMHYVDFIEHLHNDAWWRTLTAEFAEEKGDAASASDRPGRPSQKPRGHSRAKPKLKRPRK